MPATSTAGRPRGVRAAQQGSHGGAPAAAVPESEGERDGEHEGIASDLTAGSIWAEGGWRVEIDVRGGALVGTTMVAGGVGLDSAGERLNRARGGMAWVQARRGRSGREGFKRGGEGWSAWPTAMALLELGSA